jgi:UDP-N-acetylglucosamine 3-dehydrogenase
MSRFQVAVLGVGYWGKKIVDEYSNITGVKVRAVSDQLDSNLEFCKDRYKVPHLYHDYREVLVDETITAVNVCLPNRLHYQACRDALEAGKHILVEKPITLSSRDGHELVVLAQERNLTLSVGHIYRFNNALLEIRRLMSQNFFGRPFVMNFTWTNLEPAFPDRDVIVDLAPHFFDMVNFIYDAWPARITCTGKPYRRKEQEEVAFITCEMPSGVLANAHLSSLGPRKVRQIEIVGENRSALIDAVAQDVTVFESGYTYKLGIERNNTIRTELINFLHSIEDPTTETSNSGTIGVRTVEMIEQSMRSLREGRTVDIEG